jgi:hypothetical protein
MFYTYQNYPAAMKNKKSLLQGRRDLKQLMVKGTVLVIMKVT